MPPLPTNLVGLEAALDVHVGEEAEGGADRGRVVALGAGNQQVVEGGNVGFQPALAAKECACVRL